MPRKVQTVPAAEEPDEIDRLPQLPLENTEKIDPVESVRDQADRAVAALKAIRTAPNGEVDMDVGYYLVVVFQSTRQRREFMEAAGWVPELGDGKYISGTALARQMGISLRREAWVPFSPRSHPEAVKGRMKRMPRA